MKSVFITGAASGIGLMTAKLFSQAGYFVGLFDINEEGIESLLNSQDFPNACGCFCDVTNIQSITAAFKYFTEHTEGKLNVLINNAGVLSSGLFKELSTEHHALMIDINVKGLTNVAHIAHQYLSATQNSVMINLCSASSIHGIPYLGVYSATKHYVNGLSEALSIEWEADDIRVICIKPPVLNNRMGASIHPSLTKRMTVELDSEDVAKQIIKAVDGKKSSYLLTFKANVWAFTNRFLSQKFRRGFVKYLSSFNS
ncbi:MAG: short-chain dehydrogenase [Gammaproteobacteria bacterium]|nr:MAG: short-chain dehydrogenase [Gammaproteobacteria bacterium]